MFLRTLVVSECGGTDRDPFNESFSLLGYRLSRENCTRICAAPAYLNTWGRGGEGGNAACPMFTMHRVGEGEATGGKRMMGPTALMRKFHARNLVSIRPSVIIA